MKYIWLSILMLFLTTEISPKLYADVQASSFSLTSPAFKDQENIPKTHACDRLGNNRSPKLQWTNSPSNTTSFALVCHDPDAFGGLFVHWIIYNIPAQADHLDEGIARSETLPNGAKQGINSFQRVGYDGPCPPSGAPHHYIFTLYALDTLLNLHNVSTLDTLNQGMKGHILEKAQLIGTFQSGE
jgi:Raf kinase inhibitor-like YbhB/YbcL family protein